jgi:protein-S-isoprenylcysteine O-methyltransferase Ste14
MENSGFLFILGFGLVFGVIHSTLASSRVKAFATRVFGLKASRHYRLFYVTTAVIISLGYFAPVVILKDASLYEIPTPWRYLTLVFQLGAGILFIVTLFQTSLLHFTGLATLMGEKPSADRLITNGFYRYTRHPIYLFSLILLWLLPVMTWNRLALAIGVTVYTLIGSLLEERRLAVQFGQEYMEYKKRTPWLIPIPFKHR